MRSSNKRSDVHEEEVAQANTQRQEVRMAEMPKVQHRVPKRNITERTTPRAAFIGARRIDDVSRFCHSAYLDLVERAVESGYTIRTGAAPGADQIAATRALHLGGRVELVLPWSTYEKVWVNEMIERFGTRVDYIVYDDVVHIDWTESVSKYHPAPRALKPYARALHARNYGIIEPCEVVVALTAPDRKGGTEQGIRIAEALDKRRIILESNTESGDRSRRMDVEQVVATPAGLTSRISFQPLGSAEESI